MRSVMWIFGASVIALGACSTEHKATVADTTRTTKGTPLILAENEGERREFRTRPGTFFTLKVDPRNGGSEHLTVLTEDMAPGDKIPTHRHPNADELIIIHTGTAQITLGDRVQEAQAGTIVFIPADTWIGVENSGKGHLIATGVMSAPGYEEYLRAISVPAGQPNTPLSRTELEELRKKHLHDGVYQ